MKTQTLDDLLQTLQQRDIQLWLDGDRLRYRAAKDAFTPELKAQIKAQKSAIITFLRQAQSSSQAQLPPIERIDRDGKLPLSFAQQRFWFLQQFEPDSTANNMPVVVRFQGAIDLEILHQSLKAVMDRQEVFRSRFPLVEGEPVVVIEDAIAVDVPVEDIRHVPAAEREAEAHRLATLEARRPFDLMNGPVVRIKLFQVQDDEYLLIWNMHSIVCDGASSDVFYQDFTAIYTALATGQPLTLPDLPIQYVDYAHWQRQWLQGEVLDNQLAYWKELLAGDLPVLPLPYDQLSPPGMQTYRSDRCARMLSPQLNQQLQQLSQKLGGTLFMTLMTTFEIMLYRYGHPDEMVLSFASAGRAQVETERLMGFFSNTLMMRTDLRGNPTFRELLERVKADSLKTFSNQDLPFERLIQELPPEREIPSRSPHLQVKFALNPPWTQGRGMAPVELPGLTITSLFGYIYHGMTKYDILMVMREQEEGLGMVFGYNTHIFESQTVEAMMDYMETLLEEIVANPDARILEIPMLPTTEQDWQLSQKVPNLPGQATPTTPYILDRYHQLLPRGATGTLYVEGAIASRPTIPHPHSDAPNAQLYNTGELARYRADGTLQRLGHPEDQVYIRGFRLEIEKLVATLTAMPAIAQCAVVPQKDSKHEQRLIAYVVCTDAIAPQPQQWLAHLKEQLSEYLIPAAFVVLPSLPMSTDGRVDRAALPAPQESDFAALTQYVAPKDDLEHQLAAIWQSVLQCEQVGTQDDFFELGGHSLLAARLLAEIEQQLGHSIPIGTLFQAPTVQGLAQHLRQDTTPSLPLCVIPIQVTDAKVPLFCVHVLGRNLSFFKPLAQRLEYETLYGLVSGVVSGDPDSPHPRDIRATATYYINAIKAVQPVGPYHFVGVSFGGWVAYEIAQQLRQQGDTVNLVGLFDSYCPVTFRRYRLQRMQRHLQNLRTKGLQYGVDKSQRLLRKVRNKVMKPTTGDTPQSQGLPDGWSQADREAYELLRPDMHEDVNRDYEFTPYPGEIELFRSQEDPDPKLNWRQLASQGLIIHDIPGDHLGMLREPNVQVIAERLRTKLN